MFLSISKSFAATTSNVMSLALASTQSVAPIAGRNLSAVINTDTGNLSVALNPGFDISSNAKPNGVLILKVEITDSSLTLRQAILPVTGGPIALLLANTTNRPTNSDYLDIKNGTLTSNANIIAYPFTVTTDKPADVTITYNNTTNQYDIVTDKNQSKQINTQVTSLAPIPNTYTFLDSAGSYEAAITLTYTSL